MKQYMITFQNKKGERVYLFTNENPNAIFVTLTISDEAFEYIMDKYNIDTNEDCCKKMIRLYL
jgi:hypothetical protein